MVAPVSYIALRGFVEVGRQGSVKRAARALNVTPGAVSQQVKALEARLGVRLLVRGNREVALSAEGKRLYARTAPGFDAIDRALADSDARRHRGRSLTISTTPAFAACWLAPRLGRFTARHPDIEIGVQTAVRLADLGEGGVDIAIRHGGGDYPGLDVTPVFRPRLIAVASPAWRVGKDIRRPADCLRYPLLQDRERGDWSAWLEANGVAPSKAAAKGPSYANDGLLIEAACAGQGIAIVRDIYAFQALANGTLVTVASGASAPTAAHYYVVCRADAAARSKIFAFRRWIIAEMAALRRVQSESWKRKRADARDQPGIRP